VIFSNEPGTELSTATRTAAKLFVKFDYLPFSAFVITSFQLLLLTKKRKKKKKKDKEKNNAAKNRKLRLSYRRHLAIPHDSQAVNRVNKVLSGQVPLR
jgi:hypothetical protein